MKGTIPKRSRGFGPPAAAVVALASVFIPAPAEAQRSLSGNKIPPGTAFPWTTPASRKRSGCTRRPSGTSSP